MKRSWWRRFVVLTGTAVGISLLVTCSQHTGTTGEPAQTDQTTKKQFDFKGKVEQINADAKTIAVNNEGIPGWMSSMTMTYAVDQPDILQNLKTGDQITATVYEGDFHTLYGVKVVPPEPAQ